MPQYEYQGINATGRSVKGQVISENLGSAKSQLRRQGIFPSQILEVSVSSLKQNSAPGIGGLFQRVPVEVLATATRQLSTLVGAHVPLVQALDALIEQVEHQKLRAAFSQVRSDVNEGMAFNKALSRFPDIFSDLYVNMVASGEASGALDIVMSRLADFLEYQDRLKKRITGAMIYPVIMIVVGIAAIMIIFTVVIPQIEQIFRENKQTLPLITQVILAISRFLVDWWWAVIAGVALLIYSVRQYLKTAGGKTWWHDKQLKLPIFGDLIRMVAVSRFTKTLATLLQSGVPLLSGLSIVKNVVGNLTILRAIEQATTDLTEGANISDPLKRSGQFPPLVTHMISVGEKTGELEQMLDKVSEHYEYQVNSKVTSFTAILEPIFIVILAGIVLVVVLSVVLPMLEMNDASL